MSTILSLLIYAPIIICPFTTIYFLVLAIKAITDKDTSESWKKYTYISGISLSLCISVIFFLFALK